MSATSSAKRTAIAGAKPGERTVVQRAGVGFWSVRWLIACGFGFLILVLAGVTAASAWQVNRHQEDLEDLEFHSVRASTIQNVEVQASVAGLLLQRYIESGSETYPEEINQHAAAAQLAIEQVIEMGAPPGFEEVATIGLQLMSDASRAAELRRLGAVDLARQVVEDIVPLFREYRLTLEALTADELAQVADLRAQANETGAVALTLLVLSGAIGVFVAVAISVFIARSIIRPLGALEATAVAVTKGNMDARVEVRRPREFAHLGRVINDMMARIQAHTTEIEERNRQLLDARAQAATDGLTGVLNHRAFQERIRELTASASSANPIALVMLDIDGFKLINDTHGHQRGDEILRACTDRCVAVAGQDYVFRYGGDEIAVVVPAGGLREGEALAERLRLSLSEITNAEQAITVSLGVAAYPETASSAQELIYQADSAMYAAKSSGKNRVCRWDDVFSGEVKPPSHLRRSRARASLDEPGPELSAADAEKVLAALAGQLATTPEQAAAQLHASDRSPLAAALARVLGQHPHGQSESRQKAASK